MVEQDGGLGQINGFGLARSNVECQHLNQTDIIGNIRRYAVREEGKPQRVHGERPFNPVGGFVKTEALRRDARRASVLHRLGVNDD